MGGEQSRDAGGGVGVGGGGVEGVDRRGSDPNRPTSTSPRPSICSDSDLPYIPYTVNRPIGEPLRRRQQQHLQRPQEVVVVREASANTQGLDPELARLQSIPTFLPIMRGALTAPSARDPEVLERLDSAALVALCRRYQAHLHATASATSQHQDLLSSKIREVDSTISGLVTQVTERQRNFARYADKLNQVNEISHALSRCHASLNLILESLETLNNSLPIQDRLEPFVWTTG
ncbi:BLOC-1-related complex subunit 5-like [Penaeus monodon]|uniref:BLOC-1-related complex subunit 5-like n=1 Tax=Penaeus monodon TaxID=6687 RepID=UPI0018A77A34|nr:BLOC-1-related complex subunit 5-like [Penaeus monodon]